MPKPRILLVPHDPRWARAFAAARAAIMQACGDHVPDVVHVGSTAIPGIAAKPVIDLMALLRRHEDDLACVGPMAALGYEFRSEAGLGDTRAYSDAKSEFCARIVRLALDAGL